MIVECRSCGAKYEMDREKLPARVMRVRCPGCSAVFRLDAVAAAESTEVDEFAADAAAEFAADAAAEFGPEFAADAAAEFGPEFAADAAADTAAYAAAGSGATPDPIPDRAAPAVESPPDDDPGSGARARLLARALASDILLYHRRRRDDALARGELLVELAPEIRAAWSLYKSRVCGSRDLSTAYFRNAIEEILADGNPLFN